MVSWRKLFNKFLFLKSASPPSREGRILFFIFIPWNTRFQSPFSFTIHLHSLIRVSRRDKKKHFEIQITRGYSARGTRCPPTARLVVHFANTPLSSILTGTSKHRIAATSEAWHRPFWSARHVFGYFLRHTGRENQQRRSSHAASPPLAGLYCFF